MSVIVTEIIFNDKMFTGSRKLILKKVISELNYREISSGDCSLYDDFYDMETKELEAFAEYLEKIL